MSARDPETGQFTATNTSEVEYADHEVQVLAVRFIKTGDGSDVLIEPTIEFEPVSERGIDSDELAQLVGWKRHATVGTFETGESDQSFVGEIQTEVDFGINLTKSEAAGSLTGANAASPTVIEGDDIGGETTGDIDAARYYRANQSEPGQLDHFLGYAGPGFIDDEETAGGGGYSTSQDMTMWYPEKLGSGPYVDRTDDLVMLPEWEVDDVSGRAEFEITYILYWAVEEMPEGRASFARP